MFLGPYLQHMEVPRLVVKSELQLPAYATATAMQNPSHVCDLYHSSQQHRIFNPLGEARDQTHVLMDTSRIRYLWSHDGNSDILMKRKVTHEVPLIHNLSLIGFFPFPEATVLRFLPVVFKGIKVGFFFFSCSFWPTPTAYGSFHARG